MDRVAAELELSSFGAALFDLDGVVTPTSETHERAWPALSEPWEFAPTGFRTEVDGNPRYDGVGMSDPWPGVDVDGNAETRRAASADLVVPEFGDMLTTASPAADENAT